MQTWASVKDYEGLYRISNNGDVFSIIKNRCLKGTSANGYRKVELWKDSKGKKEYVHRLVAMAFVDNPNNLPEVNHKDGNRLNNRYDNLEWVTSSGNTKHAVYSHALKPWGNGAKPIEAIDILTGLSKYFPTISEAEREIGSRHITDVLKGKRKSCKGYTFRYVEGR